MANDHRYLCYQAVNLINFKRYIGWTGRSIAARRSSHKAAAKRGGGVLFGAAIRKYGIENFRFGFLCGGMTKAEVFREEVRLIAALKPEYNASPGGDGGGPPPLEQLMHFYEGRARASEDRKRPVVCLTDGRRWSSIKDAAAAVGAQYSEVAMSCRCLHRYVKGFRFAYDEPGLDMAAEMARRDALQRYRKGFPKPPFRKTDKKQVRDRMIVDLLTGKRYASVSVAAKALGKTTGQISHACKSKTIGRDGSVIRYENDLGESGGVSWVQGRQRSVVCVQTNEVFLSAAAAGRQYGVTGALISAVCNHRPSYHTAAGQVFRWAE